MTRADVYLCAAGYAKSRSAAKELIEKGSVTLDGKALKKASELVDEAAEHTVLVKKEPFVCRGGLKLEGAISAFGTDVSGKICIDIGASTGGFTDCLLSHGAKKVYAVDSGHGQLDSSLASRDDVVNIEGYNARNLKRADFDTDFDIAVMDVSFISQTYIHAGISDVLRDDGVLISLIKPQFEAGRHAVGKNGIVKKKEDREAALRRVIDSAALCGLYCRDVIRSPIDGGDGNIEYLALFTKEAGETLFPPTKIKILAEGRKTNGDGT